MKHETSQISSIKEFTTDLYRNDKFEIYYEDENLMVLRGVQPYAQVLQLPDYGGHTRMELNEIMFCLEGSMKWQMNGVEYTVEKNSVILFPSKYVVNNVFASDDVKMIDVCVSSKLLNQLLGSDIDCWNKVVYKDDIKTIKMSDLSVNGLVSNFEFLRLTSMVSEKYKFYDKIVHSFIQTVLYTMLTYFVKSQSVKEFPIIPSRGKDMFDHFLVVLTATTPKRHPISYYANKLSITTNYLTILCKQYSGKSASEWILEYTLEEVRYYLTQSNLAIKDVAAITGFDNVAFFGKFVKHHFGYTPLDYRKKH